MEDMGNKRRLMGYKYDPGDRTPTTAEGTNVSSYTLILHNSTKTVMWLMND